MMPSVRSTVVAISMVAGLFPAAAGAHIGQSELFKHQLSPGPALGSMSGRLAYATPPTQVVPDTELTPVQEASAAQSPRSFPGSTSITAARTRPRRRW